MVTDKERLVSLRRVHEATNEAVEDLEKKYREVLEDNLLMREKLINCQKSLDITKEIMRNALIEQNAIKDSYGREIAELREKIKVLNGNNNKLGN